MKKALIWNDWSLSETKGSQKGDILGGGAWGKIVIIDEKHVVKMPNHQNYCVDFEHEHNILTKLKSVTNPIINTLNTDLFVAVYKHKTNQSEVEILHQKYVHDTNANENTNENAVNTSCIFEMERILPPKLQNLYGLVNLEKQSDLEKYHSTVIRPYYIFLGRLGPWSIVGTSKRNTDVGTLSLTDFKGVIPDMNIPSSVLQTVYTDYPGSGRVVSNYSVEPGSFPHTVGKSMCKYVWDALVQTNIILYDTEFVYGTDTSSTERSSKVFMIDCNLCENKEFIGDNVVKTELPNHFAEAMDIRLPTVNMAHWGGFLPNPLLSPNFAIECLNDMVNNRDSFANLLKHANFMTSFFNMLSDFLTNYDDKYITSKHERDIKQTIVSSTIKYSVKLLDFKSIPTDHPDADGMENQIKSINKKLSDAHAYFQKSFSKSYLLELALAQSKLLYNALKTADNLYYLSEIVSFRMNSILLDPNFSLSSLFDSSIFAPAIQEMQMQTNSYTTDIVPNNGDTDTQNTVVLSKFSIFGDMNET